MIEDHRADPVAKSVENVLLASIPGSGGGDSSRAWSTSAHELLAALQGTCSRVHGNVALVIPSSSSDSQDLFPPQKVLPRSGSLIQLMLAIASTLLSHTGTWRMHNQTRRSSPFQTTTA